MSHASSQPKKILISRVSAHGDVMQTLPLLERLYTLLSETQETPHIGWLVEESAAPLLENNPLIHTLHICKRKHWVKQLSNPVTLLSQGFKTRSELSRFINEIRAENYDISIDVQGLLKSALWPWLAGIPARYGFKNTRENAHWFYTHKLSPHELHNPDLPTVEVFARFIEESELFNKELQRPLSYPTTHISTTQQANIDAVLKPLQSHPASHTIVLAPFTQWASKHWDTNHWITLGASLLKKNNAVVLIGAPSDVDSAAHIAQGIHQTYKHSEQKPAKSLLNLVGQTSLQDLQALFTSVDALVGLDSAPLHIANSMKHTAIVGLFGPTGSKRTGAYPASNPKYRNLTSSLECQPCFKRQCKWLEASRSMPPENTPECLSSFTPEMVLHALEEVLYV